MAEADPRRHEIPHVDIFCASSRKHSVPVDLLRAVWLSENRAISVKDQFQSALFELMTVSLADDWWERWWMRLRATASRSRETFVLHGKWGSEVIRLGGVFSIGPAQITPLTALSACDHNKSAGGSCHMSVRDLLKSTLSAAGSVDVAALVLQYERDLHLREAGEDIASDWEEWATMYNFGGARFRHYYSSPRDRRANAFSVRARHLWRETTSCP